MPVIQRAQDILLKPKDTWPRIEQEPGDSATIYAGYLIFLAAIPAVAGFIGLSVLGLGWRVPIMAGLVHMVVAYVLSLVSVFVLSLITDALAPSFGGTRNPLNALKLVAYASTAGFVGGIFSLIPALAVLGLLCSLYSIYLIYTGLPVLMKCPPERAAPYTAVVVVCGFIAAVVFSAVAGTVLPTPGRVFFGSMGSRGADVHIDTDKLEALRDRMEAVRGKVEAATEKLKQSKAGQGDDQPAHAAIPAQDLKALLPDNLAGLPRQSLEVHGGEAMGLGGSAAQAEYAGGDKQARLSITDLGSLGGVAAFAAWANISSERETADEVERVYKQGERTLREQYRKDGSHAETMAMLPNGLLVEARGEHVDLAALKQAIAALDLAHLESLARPAR